MPDENLFQTCVSETNSFHRIAIKKADGFVWQQLKTGSEVPAKL